MKDILFLQTKDRVEKIVAAIYLLTEHMDNGHGLRKEIRSSADNLLRALIFLSKDEVGKYKDALLSILNVLLILKEIGSENASIIKDQLNTVSFEEGAVLSHVFVSDTSTFVSDAKDTKQESFLSGTVALKTKMETHNKLYLSSKGHTIHVDDSKGHTKGDDLGYNKKDEKRVRRDRILSLLLKTDVRSIKDIAPHFTDCSEKTIQRELNDLVDEKKILRVGDRRWSTYKLA